MESLAPHALVPDLGFATHFLPDGRHLLVDHGPKLARFTLEGEAAGTTTLRKGGPKEENLLAFHPGSPRVVGGIKRLSLVDLESGEKLADLASKKYCLALAFSPGGEQVAVGCGSLLIWEPAAEGKPRQALNKTEVVDLAYSPDGAWLAAAGRSAGLFLLDAASLEPALHLEGDYQKLAFTPEGDRLHAMTFLGDHRVVTLGSLALSEPAPLAPRDRPLQWLDVDRETGLIAPGKVREPGDWVADHPVRFSLREGAPVALARPLGEGNRAYRSRLPNLLTGGAALAFEHYDPGRPAAGLSADGRWLALPLDHRTALYPVAEVAALAGS